jgi:hypothetical protein
MRKVSVKPIMISPVPAVATAPVTRPVSVKRLGRGANATLLRACFHRRDFVTRLLGVTAFANQLVDCWHVSVLFLIRSYSGYYAEGAIGCNQPERKGAETLEFL